VEERALRLGLRARESTGGWARLMWGSLGLVV
jgi:hypothetical protein